MSQFQAKPKTIGGLKTLIIEGTARGPAIILFHGYGADAADLLPLVDLMSLSKDVTWVFPDAPLKIISAPGMHGRAWYPIDTELLERSLRMGEPADLSAREPQGLDAARESALALYEELRTHHPSVIVGGFSQGATLATELTFTAKVAPTALVVMSGTVICESRWRELAPHAHAVPFFQCHGKNDPLLGFQFAENLYSLLTDAGLNGEFMTFSGGHEIPPKAIEKIARFITKTFRS